MQASSSTSTSGGNSSTSMYNMTNNLSAITALGLPLPLTLSSDASSSSTFSPASFAHPSLPSGRGMYGPPRASLADDFIDIDVYSVHLSDDEEVDEEQALQPTTSSFPLASFDLPSGIMPRILSQVSVGTNYLPSSQQVSTTSTHNWDLASSSQNLLPSTQPPPQSDLYHTSSDLSSPPTLEQIPPLTMDEVDTTEMLLFRSGQSSIPSTDDVLSISSPSPPRLTFFEGLSTNFSFEEEVVLMPVTEIASGSSMTSTLVNLLRGLDLLDWYTLEDLCDLSTRKRRCPLPRIPTGRPNETVASPEAVMTRKRSTSLPPRIDSSTLTNGTEKGQSGGRLVDYLLTCSRLGSTSISDFLRPPLTLHSCVFCATAYNGTTSTAPKCEKAVHISCTPCQMLSCDWRRGRSDGFVCVVSGDDCNSDECYCSSLSPSNTFLKPHLSRLLVGKFLPGSDWSGYWPTPGHISCPSTEAHLIEWVTTWLRYGAVPFLAQLDSRAVKWLSTGDYFGELSWRHRIVFGVSGNYMLHLSNPLEVVPASTVLKELAKLTSLSISKTDLLRFWHRGWGNSSADDNGDKLQFEDDLSLLAIQKDPRWATFNVLGQVISTLRGFDESQQQLLTSNSQHHQDSGRQAVSSLSQPSEMSFYSSDPYLVIPSSQRPGFSLFTLRRPSNNKTNITDQTLTAIFS